MTSSYWGGEPVTAERRDVPAASCMAVDGPGRYALLASRRLLLMVDLQRPAETVRSLSWQSKYDAGTAAWSRAGLSAANVAITYNTQVAVFLCDGADLRHVCKLQSHKRSITDLDWHWTEPLLATCSVDASVHIWDVREPRRPAASMGSVESACQVKWNRLSSHTLASSHEGDIRVWDRRKLSIPERYIAAHTGKIHGLDWSPSVEHQLVTASQDLYVKFIDVSNPRNIVSMPKTKDPVWRARYTPFGSGLVTAVVPQWRRGDNCLFLWNTNNLVTPVHTFLGHTDVVLEFAWRAREDEAEYELVTWSRDQTLRLWQLEPHLLQMCGHEVSQSANPLDTFHKASPTGDDMDLGYPDTTTCSVEPSASESGPTSPARGSAPPRIRRALSEGPPLTPSQPKTLEQEFRMINKNIDNVRIERLDAVERQCQVSVVCGALSVSLLVTFPPSYPNVAPELRFLEVSRLGAAGRQQLASSWQFTAEQHVKRTRSCLEPCLRNLASGLQRLAEQQEEAGLQASASALFPSANVYGTFKDVNVPFPRTSGGRFCANGTLVVFACPVYMKRVSSRGDGVTPRSLSALDAYLVNYAQGAMGLSLVYAAGLSRSPTGAETSLPLRLATSSLGRRNKAYVEERQRQKLYRNQANLVLCYDASRLMPLSRELAERYVLSGDDFASMCTSNAQLAGSAGRRDLERVWGLLALVGEGRLVRAAADSDPDAGRPWATHPFGRPLVDSVLAHYLRLRDVQTVAMLCCALAVRSGPGDSLHHPAPCQLLLDPGRQAEFDRYKAIYANILYKWQLPNQRALVLKQVSAAPPAHTGLEVRSQCARCARHFTGGECPFCRRCTVTCTVCHIAVRGLSAFCLLCGHGGHLGHMQQWFSGQQRCPSGCGCLCLHAFQQTFMDQPPPAAGDKL